MDAYTASAKSSLSEYRKAALDAEKANDPDVTAEHLRQKEEAWQNYVTAVKRLSSVFFTDENGDAIIPPMGGNGLTTPSSEAAWSLNLREEQFTRLKELATQYRDA